MSLASFAAHFKPSSDAPMHKHVSFSVLHGLVDPATGQPAVRCFAEVYPGYPVRKHVPDGMRAWDVPFDAYDPPDFTHANVEAGPVWAHPPRLDDQMWAALREQGHPVWDVSLGKLTFVKVGDAIAVDDDVGVDGLPRRRMLNPAGRTGLAGRGILGKYGQNPASDLIVARRNRTTKKREFLTILRADTKQLSTTGGMVDPEDTDEVAESATTGLVKAGIRELIEEALSNGDEVLEELKAFLKTAGNLRCIDGGFVDDVRNTDHAWMVTGVFVCLLPDELADKIELQERNDEASGIAWRTYDEIVEHPAGVFASHKTYFAKADAYIATLLQERVVAASTDRATKVARR